MSVQFHRLKVKDVIKETDDAVSISFVIPDGLIPEFDYKPGQYLTLKADINGESQRRAYSICTEQGTDKDLMVTVKKADFGVVSGYLFENIKPGNEIDVMPPLGHFTIDIDDKNSKNYILIGAGSGITPLMSLMKSILRVEKKSRIYLIYQNRNSSTIIFKDQIENLIDKYTNRLSVVNVFSKPKETDKGIIGKLNEDILKSILDGFNISELNNAEYLLCGPVEMMNMAEKLLEYLKVPKSNIHKESFTAASDSTTSKIEVSNAPEYKTRRVKMVLYGDEAEFDVEPDENIMLAAIREGHDPPFSCQIGACSTCMAKLISGEVHMDEREALTDDDIANGYIISCQAHPLTDDVVIDFDD